MNLPPLHESRLTALSQSPGERVISSPRPYRAITHLAVVTAFILPVIVLPYVLTRRRLSSLHRQVDSMGATMKILQQDLSQTTSEAVTHKESARRMKTLLHQTMQEVDRLRLRADKREAKQAGSDEAIRSDLRMLLDERQHARNQGATLRSRLGLP